jgi:hypothetical protein
MRTEITSRILLQRFKSTVTALVFFRIAKIVRRELLSNFDVLQHVSGRKYEADW